MTANVLLAPYPQFVGKDGYPLNDGYVYIGEPNLAPQDNPKVAYWDEALTIPVNQPIRLSGGYMMHNGTPGRIYTDGVCSMIVLDKRKVFVYQDPSVIDMNALASQITNSNLRFENYNELRAYTGNESLSEITGSGISGLFRYDPTDNSSFDNSRDIIVGVNGKRYKRIVLGVYAPNGSQYTQSVENHFHSDKSGAIRVGGSDPAALDDQRNFWRGLPSGKATNSWRDAVGLGSFSFGRNGASYAYLSGTFGHDCVSYGVAALAGGAGSATGNPDNPSSADDGYCSFSFGKNVIAIGGKSAALCEETQAGSRASFAAGYTNKTGKNNPAWVGGASDGIGAIALGYMSEAYGDGGVSIGRFVVSRGSSVAIGSGINAGTPMDATSANTVALGAGVSKPTIMLTSGAIPTQGTIFERGVRRIMVEVSGVEAVGSDEVVSVENTGSGGSSKKTWSLLRNGTPITCFEMSSGGTDTVPAFKTTNAMGRLGSNAMPWEYIFVKYSPVVTSDRRKKTNIREIPKAWLDAVAKINYVAYEMKDSENSNVGVIAQEVIAAFESVGESAFEAGIVVGSEEDGFAVNYTALHSLEFAFMKSKR